MANRAEAPSTVCYDRDQASEGARAWPTRNSSPSSGKGLRCGMLGGRVSGADLSSARLVDTNLMGANLTGCRVYGMSAWDLNLEGATQADLIITPYGQPVITVDNLEVAQFIYLLLNN